MLLLAPGLGRSVRTKVQGVCLQEEQASHQASHGHYLVHIGDILEPQHDNGHRFAAFGDVQEVIAQKSDCEAAWSSD